MARRKKKSDFFKKIRSRFKISKRTRQKLFTVGVIAVTLFALGVWSHNRTQPQGKKKIPLKKTETLSQKPANKIVPKTVPSPHAEPIVYYKQTKPSPVSAPRSQAIPIPRVLGSAPKLVFVIDDIGNTGSHVPEIEKLGRDVTYAILPLLAHTSFFDQLSLRTGAEVILHLPLDSYKGTIPGPGLITTAMPDDYVLEELQRNLASVPHRVGVNNHMGSKGTSDSRMMDLILGNLKSRGLFFLDSRTTSQSVAPLVAKEIGMSILARDKFLDNVDEVSAIRSEVRKLAEMARRKGHGVGIGHYRLNTLKVLQEEIPLLKQAGFEIVSLRELLHYKKNTRG